MGLADVGGRQRDRETQPRSATGFSSHVLIHVREALASFRGSPYWSAVRDKSAEDRWGGGGDEAEGSRGPSKIPHDRTFWKVASVQPQGLDSSFWGHADAAVLQATHLRFMHFMRGQFLE